MLRITEERGRALLRETISLDQANTRDLEEIRATTRELLVGVGIDFDIEEIKVAFKTTLAIFAMLLGNPSPISIMAIGTLGEVMRQWVDGEEPPPQYLIFPET